ncbi:MAG: hypothetical protein M3Y58_07375, partial [Chloroflexota bacterium]|nr:hypothetical protein [Chloroflexota bacterium]
NSRPLGSLKVANDDYRLIIIAASNKEIAALPAKIGGQIARAIERLMQASQSGTRPQDMKPVQGQPRTYRVDSGEYRIVFELNETQRRSPSLVYDIAKTCIRNL